jgi:prophage regulatory protein
MVNQLQNALLRRKEVEELLQISRSSLYAKLNCKDRGFDPEFPAPVRLGKHAVRWVRSELNAYIASRPRTRQFDSMGGE